MFYVGDKLKVICYLLIASLGPTTPNTEMLHSLCEKRRIWQFVHYIFHAAAVV